MFKEKDFVRKIFIVVVLFLFLICDLVYADQKVKEYTNEILTIRDAKKVKTIASRRKARLKKLIREDPKEFLLEAMPKKAKDKLPKKLRDLIEEEEVEIEGIFGELIEEDFEKRESRLIYELKGNNGKRYEINFVHKPKVKTGSKIKIVGFSLDSDFATEQKLESVGFLEAEAWGVRRTIVILMNFQNNTATPYTKEQISATMFTDADSVNKYYNETSYGQTPFTGDVVGWVTIPADSSPCNYWEWGPLADAEAVNDFGINLDNYDLRVYVFPRAGCNFSGVAYIAGVGAFMNGRNDVRLYAHELGHNLGAYHASTYNCGSEMIAENCSTKEYGSKWDTMGYWNLHQFSGQGKYKVGFISSSERAKRVREDGTYTVVPLASPRTGFYALYVQREAGIGEYYFISYREKFGFDANLPQAMVDGVTIQLQAGSSNSKLLDTTPGDGNFANAPMVDGRVFLDAERGIRITQLSHDANGATVSVKFLPTACTLIDPIMTIVPTSITASPGDVMTFDVSVTNNDQNNEFGDCEDETFNLTARGAHSSWISKIDPTHFILPPGATGNAVWTVISPTDFRDGAFGGSVSAQTPFGQRVVNGRVTFFIVSEPVTTVTLTVDPISGLAPLTVTLTATATTPGGVITDFAWDFGD